MIYSLKKNDTYKLLMLFFKEYQLKKKALSQLGAEVNYSVAFLISGN